MVFGEGHEVGDVVFVGYGVEFDEEGGEAAGCSRSCCGGDGLDIGVGVEVEAEGVEVVD